MRKRERELARIRDRHVEAKPPANLGPDAHYGTPRCAFDKQEWPCDVAALAQPGPRETGLPPLPHPHTINVEAKHFGLHDKVYEVLGASFSEKRRRELTNRIVLERLFRSQREEAERLAALLTPPDPEPA